MTWLFRGATKSPRTSPSRKLAYLGCLTASWLAPAAAHGQTIDISAATFRIDRPVPRSAGEFPWALNREDCISGVAGDTKIVINPVLKDFNRQTTSLEVWVGSGRDCTKDDERAVNGRCGLVFSETARVTGQEIVIRPQDVIESIRTQGATTTGTAETCDSELAASVTFYVLFVDNGTVKGKGDTWTQSTIDLNAPAVPTSVETRAGDNAIFTSWVSGEDVDLQGFQMFCEETSCDDPQAASSGTAGAAGAPNAWANCSGASDHLAPGAYLSATERARYLCGSAGKFSSNQSTLTAISGTPIENGRCYAVAISAYDTALNVSALSSLACVTPREVTTFYEAYRDAGGRASGCGWAPASRLSRIGIGLLVAVGILGAGWLRRRGTASRLAHTSAGSSR